MGFFNTFSRFFLTITTAFSLGIQFPLHALSLIPATGIERQKTALHATNEDMSLQEFVEQVKDGNKGKIKGLYSENAFSLRVIQQPSGKPGFVSPVEGYATQFGMASNNNVTGMLAHNFSSGSLFFDLAVGEDVDVIYGDGTVKTYDVKTIKRFQALSPRSASSEFIDLETNEKLSAVNLFNRMYGGKHHLTLQTCIQQGEEDSWGRLFILAEPVE